MPRDVETKDQRAQRRASCALKEGKPVQIPSKAFLEAKRSRVANKIKGSNFSPQHRGEGPTQVNENNSHMYRHRHTRSKTFLDMRAIMLLKNSLSLTVPLMHSHTNASGR